MSPRGTHPNSLANLGPKWTRDDCPKAMGRPKGYVAPSEWLKRLQCLELSELKEIIDDERSTVSKIIAARQLLVAAGGLDARHSDALSASSEVADRVEGKPTQVQRIEHAIGDERPVVLDAQRWEETVKRKQIGQHDGQPLLSDDNTADSVEPGGDDDTGGDATPGGGTSIER